MPILYNQSEPKLELNASTNEVIVHHPHGKEVSTQKLLSMKNPYAEVTKTKSCSFFFKSYATDRTIQANLRAAAVYAVEEDKHRLKELDKEFCCRIS